MVLVFELARLQQHDIDAMANVSYTEYKFKQNKFDPSVEANKEAAHLHKNSIVWVLN